MIIKATRVFTRFQRFEPGSERFRKFQNPKTANRTARFGSEKSRTGTETAGFGSVWNRVSPVRNQALPTLCECLDATYCAFYSRGIYWLVWGRESLVTSVSVGNAWFRTGETR